MITQETINRLTQFEEPRFPVVSAYARVDVDPAQRSEFRARVLDLLDQIRPTAYDTSLDHEVRMSLRDDMERIAKAATLERKKPGTTAFFSCSGRDFFEEVLLPRSLGDRIVLDATPRIRPLLATLDEYHRTCAVLVDRSRARFWEFHIDGLSEIAGFRDPSLRKPDYAAGRLEDRVRNKADELSKRHYRRVVGTLDSLFRDGRFELLAIGGHPYEVPVFTQFLPHRLRPLVAGTFNLDLYTATPADVRKNVEAVVDAHEREEERRLVDEALQDAAAGQPAAIGPPGCLWAGSVAAVRTLLVQDEAVAPGVACDRDGWLALSGDTCPFCGGSVRRTPDVIDELVTAVIDEDGDVKHVKAETPLREHVLAATLRFPLPPAPGTET